MDLDLPILDRLQDCWDPLTGEEVAQLEHGLGVVFPDDYRRFLSRFNAGSWRHGAKGRVLQPSRFVEEIGLSTSFGCIPDSRFLCDDITHNVDVFTDRIPDTFLPIMDASSDLICIDFAPENYGKIFYWNKYHEGSELNLVYFVADSFAEFLRSLQPNNCLEQWTEELPAFQLAERGERQAVLDYLAGPGKPDLRNKKGQTLLMCAARNSWPKIVDILLRAGADPNALDADGWSPLHHAVWGDSLDSVKHLIAYGGNTNYHDQHGRNLAQIAKELYYFRVHYHLAPYVS